MTEVPAPRYLCSQLVTVSSAEMATVANLEGIDETRLVLECEEEIAAGEEIEIRCGNQFYAEARVTRAERHGYGWTVEGELSPLTPWSPARFRPEHLTDVHAIEIQANSTSESP
jgi:hypothetical protein